MTDDKRAPSGNARTVTVTRSWSSAGSDGTTALVLDTKEAGPIAFRVNAIAIAAIRRALADCELFLSQEPGGRA